MPITNVTTEVMDLSDLFPDVTPDTKTNSLFQKQSDVIDIDDEPKEEEKKEEPIVADDTKIAVEPPAKSTIVPVTSVSSIDDLETNKEEFENAKDGSRADLREFFKKKIEAGELNAFEDYDDTKTTLDEYLKTFKTKDFDELWKSNQEFKEKELVEKIPQQFFESLSRELQTAARYENEGGTDMKGLFKILGQVEDIKALEPGKDDKLIVENYLTAKEFGTPEEIKEQIEEWEDMGVLDKKSKGFKPQLDKMQETIVEQKLQKQSEVKQRQIEEANFFHDSVQDALKTEDLSGIRLDKKTQIELYKGLTEFSFSDSRGNRCNEMNHLLDKIMWTEPNYKLLAEVQWMLKDEAGYKKALAQKTINTNTEDTVRLLKTEQAKSRSAQVESPEPKKNIIPRRSGLFKRS